MGIPNSGGEERLETPLSGPGLKRKWSSDQLALMFSRKTDKKGLGGSYLCHTLAVPKLCHVTSQRRFWMLC